MLDRLIETLIVCAAWGGVMGACIFMSPARPGLRNTAISVGLALALLVLIPSVFYVLFGVSFAE